MRELSKSQIDERLVELRNLRTLYAKARERISILETENRDLKQRIKELEEVNKDQCKRIETISFQLEQVSIKLFGKKSVFNRIVEKKEKKERDSYSYQRPIPTNITKTEPHPIKVCAHCCGVLINRRIKIFYEEDIPLPIEKVVTKHEVETGYCSNCRLQSSGYTIPSKVTILGENIKKYICVLSIVSRMSHEQIGEHLEDIFKFEISKGEIGNILCTQAIKLRPEYQALKDSVISQKATHYDETSWEVQKEEHGMYAWVATGTDNNDTVFLLGRSRGKGNISEIGIAKVAITDDYGAYKNPFEEHELCWAHPNRKLRDLAESAEFKEVNKKRILNTYEQFSSLYKRMRKIKEEISPYLKKKFKETFDKIVRSHYLDPTPLSKIKTSLFKNKEKYFTFYKYPGIPIDNNKAERALRHLIIKRKISFGSKTQRGAETTSILASVLLSLKWNNPRNWFQKFMSI